MPPILKSTIDTNLLVQDQHEREINRKVFLREMNIAPIWTILQSIPSRPAGQFKIEWFEDEIIPWVDAINNVAGYPLGTETAFIVDNGTYWNVDDYIKVQRTGEIMGPVTDVTGNTVTISSNGRSAGTTAAAAINDNDILIILRGNIKEGGAAAESIVTQPVLHTNYIERLSHTVKVTETLDNVKLYTGSERIRNRIKKLIEHREALELKILFGEQGIQTAAASGLRHLSDGLLNLVTTNVTNVVNNPQSFTEDDWNIFMEQIHLYDGNRKTVFCSPQVIRSIGKFGRDNMQTKPGVAALGSNVVEYMSEFGPVDLVYHRFFTASYGLDWQALALDMSKIEYRPLLRTRLKTNIQPDDVHAIWDEFYTEYSLELHNEEVMGKFTVTLT